MSTPRGGWPNEGPGWPPNPSVTSWAPPPQGPPAGWAPPPQPGWGPPPQGGWGPPPNQPYPPSPPYPPDPQWQAGWGAPPPPPPRKERGRLVALVLVGALVLAGLGVGTFLLVRTTAGSGAAPPDDVPATFRTVTTGPLGFAVPPDWVDDADPAPYVVLGAELEGVTYGPRYDCDGRSYFRGVAGAAFVEGERPAEDVAEAFGRETGRSFYQSDTAEADVSLAAPRPVDVDGLPGQLVEVTAVAPDDGCLATDGTVLVLAVPTTGNGGVPGTAVLIVNGDVAGGPPSAPPVPDRATLDAMVTSARLPSI